MAKEKEESKIEITEVPTQMALAYKLPDGTTASPEELLLWIANQIWDIRKAVA